MLKKIPFYPVLFAGFCVLALMAHNIHEIALRDMWLSLLLALFIAASIYVLSRLLISDWHRAALAAFAILICFFTYGQIYNVLANISLWNIRPFQHLSLAILYGLLLVFTLYWIVRKTEKPGNWTYRFNLLSICLLVYPTFVISSNAIQQFFAYRSAPLPMTGEMASSTSARPDIYYIILDAYGREDVLKNHLGYDNSAFLAALRQRGFYVADCSQSNYAYTEYSLASSLNYDYLDHLNVNTGVERVTILEWNAVRSFLEQQGYRIVSAPSGWDMTEWKEADVYLNFDPDYSALPEFEKLVMDTTALRIVSDFNLFNINRNTNNIHRSRILSLLKNLKRLPAEEGSLFVFAHLAIPHPPYRFGPNGEWIEEPTQSRDFGPAYIGQVVFINHEILQVIDTILAKSETPPIIIIQGDHGPPPKLASTAAQKMPILNAYYLPGVNTNKVLYPSISPVNTFRVVLNSYFGQNLPLLEDVSYYAPNKNQNALEKVPYTCPSQP
ncbi:MAG TPA: sulfatase-like hydrolase/transferase [Anaerolineales bacterium]|nr:sulfatase-like hydrolase/transferase [Anaerolineales bacterium]